MDRLPLVDPSSPHLGRNMPWTALFVALLESSGLDRERRLLALSAIFAEVAEVQVRTLIEGGLVHAYARRTEGISSRSVTSSSSLLQLESNSWPSSHFTTPPHSAWTH